MAPNFLSGPCGGYESHGHVLHDLAPAGVAGDQSSKAFGRKHIRPRWRYLPISIHEPRRGQLLMAHLFLDVSTPIVFANLKSAGLVFVVQFRPCSNQA